MEELVSTRRPGELTALDSLAMQARFIVQNVRMNLLELGRILSEAKPLVPHGEWENWIRQNTDMNRRTAEQYMQAYKEFGLNPQIAALGTTKTLKLLPLTAAERKEIMDGNDVAAMSTRQLDEAIRQQKARLVEEARAEVQGRIQDLEAEIRRKNQKLQESEKNLQEAVKNSENAYTDKDLLQRENLKLKQEIQECNALIEEQQEDYRRAQEELLNVKSHAAKGDAERIPADHLTPEAFTTAVRAFIGACARMPHMSETFSEMDSDEVRIYNELLKAVESWAAGSRRALSTVLSEGMVVEA